MNQSCLAVASDLLGQLIAEGWGIDLHSHSRHSDGEWSPTELIRDARIQGVRVMALTDHDTVAGQAEMLTAGAAAGMAIITGAEITTWVGDRAYHLLCHDLDPTDEAWAIIQSNRRDRIGDYYLALLAQLRARGYAVRDQDARTDEGAFVQSPISAALLGGGFAPDLKSAQVLLRSLQLDYPVHIVGTPVEQLSHLLGHDKALVSVAHPAREERGVSNRLNEADLTVMKQLLPLAALEAHHPYHAPNDVRYYRELATKHGLEVTCGSDAHGWAVNRPPMASAPALCRGFLERVIDRQMVGSFA